MMASLVTALIAAGSVLAGILLAFWVLSSLLSSRAASRAGLDSSGGRGDRLRQPAAGRQAGDVVTGGIDDRRGERAGAGAPDIKSVTFAGADPCWQFPGAPGRKLPPRDAAIAIAGDLTRPAGAAWRGGYDGAGVGEVAAAGGVARASTMRPGPSGEGELPPEAAASLRKIVSGLGIAAAAHPEDFEHPSGETQIVPVADKAGDAAGRHLLVGAVSDDIDLPLVNTEWTIVRLRSAPTVDFLRPRSAGSADHSPAGHRQPGPAYQAGNSGGDGASEPDRSKTIIFLDAVALDTLIAAAFGAPGLHGPDYNPLIRVIKISIRPRMLVTASAFSTQEGSLLAASTTVAPKNGPSQPSTEAGAKLSQIDGRVQAGC